MSLLALGLLGCPAPAPEALDAETLAPFTRCSDECAVAFNAPPSCDSAPAFEHAVAIDASRVAEFEAAIGAPDCPLERYRDDFLNGRFTPTCVAGTCALSTNREAVGAPCSGAPDCPEGYVCRSASGFDTDVCWFVGVPACTPPSIRAPTAPTAAAPPRDVWDPDVVTPCEEGEVRIGPDASCEAFVDCAADGWPIDLPRDGVVYVDPDATVGDGSRDAPFASIVRALTSTAAAIALREGSYAKTIVTRPVALYGACTRRTEVAGLEVVAGAALVANMRFVSAVEVAPGASLVARGVLLEAPLFSAGTLTVTDSASIDAGGPGIYASGLVTLEGVAVERATEVGVYLDGAEATSRGVFVADTVARGGVADGILVAAGAEAQLEDVVVSGVAQAGLHVFSAAAFVNRVLVEDARLAVFVDAARLEGEGLRVVASRERALVLRQSTGVLADVEITNSSSVAVSVTSNHEQRPSREASLMLSRARLTNGRDSALAIVGALASATLEDVAVDGSGILVADAGLSGQRIEVTRARGAAIVARAGTLTLGDVTVRDAERGLHADRGAVVRGDRIAIDETDLAAFVIRGASATLGDLFTSNGRGNAAGTFGRGVAVEAGAIVSIRNARFESAREIAIAALGAGTVLNLEGVTVAGTLSRRCADSTCVDAPAGIGIGAYDGAVVDATAFAVEAPLACVQSTRGGRVEAQRGVLSSCAVGFVQDSTMRPSDVCLEGVTTPVQSTGVVAPDLGVPGL